MSEVEATSGAGTVSSATVEEVTKPVDASGAADNGKDQLFAKLKTEKDNWRKRAQELEAAMAQKTEEELKAKEEFKQLYELEKDSKAKALAKLEAYETQIQTASINSKLRDELTKYGLKPGHTEDVFKLIDKTRVKLDPDTGAVVGAEDLAKEFYEKYSTLGFFNRPGIGVDHSSPKLQTSNTLTQDNYMEELRAARSQKEFEAIRKKYKKN